MKSFIVLSLIASMYDFIIVYFVITERASDRTMFRYHVIQFIIDIIFIPIVSLWFFHFPFPSIIAFVEFKIFHGCDSLFNIYRYVWTNESTTDLAEWRWWSMPFGLPRTIYLSIKNKRFIKSEVSIRESWISAGIGLTAACLTILLWT